MAMKNMLSKLKKINYNFQPILFNRFILYFFVIISLIQIIFCLSTNDVSSLFVFILVGILVSFFNKNMIVILCLALVVTNILKYGLRNMRVSEGFESSDEKSELTDTELNDNILKKSDKKIPDVKSKDTDKNQIKKGDDSVGKKDEKSLSDKEKKLKEYQELKKDFPEFKQIQSQILKGISEIDPLLDKAENFIDKFEHFSNKH
jgi:hypothetical protein